MTTSPEIEERKPCHDCGGRGLLRRYLLHLEVFVDELCLKCGGRGVQEED